MCLNLDLLCGLNDEDSFYLENQFMNSQVKGLFLRENTVSLMKQLENPESKIPIVLGMLIWFVIKERLD